MIDRSAIIPESLRPVLAMLLTAFDYAEDCRIDRWQFALEMTELLAKGASLVDLRWLILCGFAEHGREITLPGEDERSFRPLAFTCFPSDTCLVLSPQGADVLRVALATNRQQVAALAENVSLAGDMTIPAAPLQHPEWDEVQRELRYQGTVIKRYRVPAPKQELILAAFQNLDWPVFIDNPLPRAGETDQSKHLQVTIKSLNRNLCGALIKFHGNGSGRQIRWTIVESE